MGGERERERGGGEREGLNRVRVRKGSTVYREGKH